MKIINVDFSWDDDAGVWIAINDEVPLALEAGSLDVLMERVKATVPEILSLNGDTDDAKLRFSVDRLLDVV